MRFGVPRSLTPSPERKAAPSRSRFRVPSVYDSDSSDEDISTDEGDTSIDPDISVASASSTSEDEIRKKSGGHDTDLMLPWEKLRISSRPPEEERTIMETVQSVRSHSRYVDSYEEWEKRTRQDAFYTARRQQFSVMNDLRNSQQQLHVEEQRKYDDERKMESTKVMDTMLTYYLKRDQTETKLREQWKQRDKALWDRVEQAIKDEEEKHRVFEEQERKRREEEEKKQKEEEQRKQREEEEKKAAEAEKKRVDLEQRLAKEKEERERLDREEALKLKKAQNEATLKLREATGLFDADDMWKMGLRALRYIKNVTMRAVKGPRLPNPEPEGYQAPPPPPLKKLWNAQRRKITPKIGQLTNDEKEIKRISDEIKAIIAPIPNMPRPDDAQSLFHALLVSFSKTVIAQAETEVSAHKSQARPLARVCISLISTYPELGDIFWARLCARAGCWAAGVEPVLLEDETSDQLSDKEKQKRWGSLPEEGSEEKMMRIAGIMRLYFSILSLSMEPTASQPMPVPFRPARLWMYLSQLLNNSTMLEKPVAAEIIYVALDEGGNHATKVWGGQFIKMLQLIYECLQGEQKTRIGGSEVLAQGSRGRCLLEIEKIMGIS